MPVTRERTDNLLSRLANIPARIAGISSGWSSETLQRPPSPDGWSALEILAHLRASDAILVPRVYAILLRDEPSLLAFDERRWADLAQYMQFSFSTLLQHFALRRGELVEMLCQISSLDWERCGIHEVHGPQTIFVILTTLVEHEEEHCAQLSAIYRT
jgi:DinB superfamily